MEIWWIRSRNINYQLWKLSSSINAHTISWITYSKYFINCSTSGWNFFISTSKILRLKLKYKSKRTTLDWIITRELDRVPKYNISYLINRQTQYIWNYLILLLFFHIFGKNLLTSILVLILFIDNGLFIL